MLRISWFVFISFFAQCTVCFAAGYTVDHTASDLSQIPDVWITKAKQDLHIIYKHTSHGSQIITGMNALKNYPDFGDKYAWLDSSQGDSGALSLDDRAFQSPSSDLSQGDSDSNGDGYANWANHTYDLLADSANYHVNVFLWSWCNISSHNIPRYLNSMEWLIGQFSAGGSHVRAAAHPVQFVYITAHANGGGENDSSDAPNRQIRDYCSSHDCILFDFADLENYDPDENYFLNKNLQDDLDYDPANNWASEYLTRHSGTELYKLTKGDGSYGGAGSCSHSNGPDNDARLNCVLKGRAAWHLFARLAGWNPDGQANPVAPGTGGNSGVNGAAETAAIVSVRSLLLRGH